MAQTVFAIPQLSDDATLTGGTTASGMPVSNLQEMQPSTITRWTDLANAYVEADMGGDRFVDLAALLYSNASVDAAWQVRAASTQADLTANPAYDSGKLTFHGHLDGITLVWSSPEDDPSRLAYDRAHATHVFSGATHRWWRVDVYDSGNADGFINAGRLYLADSFRPAVNIRFGWGLAWNDGEERAQARGGQIFPRERTPLRRFNGKLRVQSEADLYDELFRLQRLRGTAKDVLVLVDKDNADRQQDWVVNGLFSELRPIVNDNVGLYQADLSITELL